MNLYEYIFKRKSTRKYDLAPLDAAALGKIRVFADNLKRLYPEIATAYEITDTVKNLMPIKAPHDFLLLSEEKGDYLQNIGFMWQQMDLFLSELGLGSCWLGMAKPTSENKMQYPHSITLAFGKAEDSPYREQSDFKRKPISEISSGSDNRLEAARLAPSATNSQNWFFGANSGEIDVYQKKVNPIAAAVYGKMNRIDIGIALCHLYLATEHEGKEFALEKQSDKDKKGYIYTGTVK